MKLSLIKKPFGPCPPDGFRYVFPEDGWTAHAWCYTDWIDVAVAHLRANGKDAPPDLAERMEDQLCQTLDPGWCAYDDPNRPRPVASLGWDDVKGALATFGRWLKDGCEVVTQEEAERRAQICSRCYLNVHITGCSVCQRMVSEVVGDKKTSVDGVLKACGACKCVLRAKVWFPIKTLDTETEKLQSIYPEHCWQRKDGPNFNG